MPSRRSSLSLLLIVPAALAIAPGCGGKSGQSGAIPLPRLYPPVREMTPSALVADATYASTGALTARTSGLDAAGGAGGTSPPITPMDCWSSPSRARAWASAARI